MNAVTDLTEAAWDRRLDVVFRALADPTRRAMLVMLLTKGEATVTELASPFSMSQPAVTKHLKVLERARLVSRSRDAQRRPAVVNVETIGEVLGWLESYRRIWEENYARLDVVLEELETAKGVQGGGS
ncbi:MAG: metalloregulator ArsR/SmtB family transcription factor [Spirochaetales bacterium]|nr:metalloregulator ArsR/SmtB family transcription factor [Spirochaetales bacterium]